MSDLLKKVQSGRTGGPIDWILRKLPGFKGYEDMQERRAADTLLRNHIVALLKGQMTELIKAEKVVLNGRGGLSHMSKMKDAKSKFQVFIDRIGTAMPGYAGFFDAVRVGPAELQKIYNFDADLLDYVDLFKAKIDAVELAAASNEGLDKAIEEFETLAIQANTTFANRENVLTQL